MVATSTSTPRTAAATQGNYDVLATTNANGSFTLTAPYLPEGYTQVRLVVIGQADAPPLPGLSSVFNSAFRIDNTAPIVTAATLAPGGSALPPGSAAATDLNSLTNLSLDVEDPINPTSGPLATPTAIYYDAINPTTASNISNYSLINVTDPAARIMNRTSSRRRRSLPPRAISSRLPTGRPSINHTLAAST